MQVFAEETWSWMLIENEGAFILSVLCGGIAMYGIDFALSEPERASYEAQGRSYLVGLALEATCEPNRFLERRMPDIDSLPGLHEAIAAWRAGNQSTPS